MILPEVGICIAVYDVAVSILVNCSWDTRCLSQSLPRIAARAIQGRERVMLSMLSLQTKRHSIFEVLRFNTFRPGR
jgi:hypothetical protein